MFASLLYNYRTGFVDNLEESSFKAGASRLYFSKEKFLKHSDKDTRVIKKRKERVYIFRTHLMIYC
jgi:hypothetical protein